MKASIIFITWAATEDRMRLLKNCLSTLKDSTEVEHELIVVDNGPIEQTEFLKTQKIDKHIINKINMGIGYARNQGMDVATGEYVVFLDNDILVEKGWLGESIEALETYPNEKLVGCPIYGDPSGTGKRRLYLGMLGKYPLYQRYGGACWVKRRKMLDKFGKWSTNTVPGREYCGKITRAGYRFIGLEKHKATHLGKKKSFNFHKILINGEWVERDGNNDKA